MTGNMHKCLVDECDYTNESIHSIKIHLNEHGEDVVKDVYLDELQRLADELGKTPSYDDMTERGWFSPGS